MTAALAITDPTLVEFAEKVGPHGPVAVAGARTRWGLGGTSLPGTRLVRAPIGIVDYRPAEMTVQVRAGTRVTHLHRELAMAGQRTALPDRGGTVGGALAVGEDDVCVMGVGRVRTTLLQIRYVSADGKLVTGGGPTVKNVTGFDLPRLMVGSLGALGLFAETILRTNPLPAVSMWLISDQADPFAARDALFRPSAVLWDGRRTWIQLEGHGPDVEAQRRVLEAIGPFEQTPGPPDLPPHRWSLQRSQLREANVQQFGDRFVASLGSGTVFAHRAAPHAALAPNVRALIRRVKAEFDPTGRLNPGRDITVPRTAL